MTLKMLAGDVLIFYTIMYYCCSLILRFNKLLYKCIRVATLDLGKEIKKRSSIFIGGVFGPINTVVKAAKTLQCQKKGTPR